MTLPYEEQRALHQARKFLVSIYDLRHPVKLRELRKRVSCVLRHYPMTSVIDEELYKKRGKQ